MAMDRREFCRRLGGGALLGVLLGGGGLMLRRAVRSGIYQIDPEKCQSGECGRCKINCVRKPSAVKAVNDFEACGYCVYCYGYFPDRPDKDPNARVCPTGALKRKRVGEYEYEYTVNEEECVGCGKCVKRCRDHGHASLSLQVRGHLCKECNRCEIAARCPSEAIFRNTLEA